MNSLKELLILWIFIFKRKIMSGDMRKMIDKIKNCKQFVNENIELIKENKNFIYTNADYERYLSLESDIVESLNKILPNNEYHFFESTWYRRSHKNDKDLIFQEMNFPSKSITGYSVNIQPLSKDDREIITNVIKQLIQKHGITSVKIFFNNENRGVYLEKFKDKKIKKVDKGRGSFVYPINGWKIKFIISDRDLSFLGGVTSLNNIFNNSETLTIDGSYRIVSYASEYIERFIKIDDEIFKLNDVEKTYVDFFQDTREIETQGNVGTKDIMFKTFILNNLKTYNNHKDITDLFDMLDTINFDFVYYNALDILKGEHYVTNI